MKIIQNIIALAFLTLTFYSCKDTKTVEDPINDTTDEQVMTTNDTDDSTYDNYQDNEENELQLSEEASDSIYDSEELDEMEQISDTLI